MSDELGGENVPPNLSLKWVPWKRNTPSGQSRQGDHLARLRIASSWENQDFRVFFLVITRAHIADSKSINMCGVIV